MPRSGLLLPALSAAAIAMSGATAQAATLNVNTPIDSISTGPGQCSLREAIQEVDSPGTATGGCAPAAFGANTIVLGQGTYSLHNGLGELKVTPEVTDLTITGRGVDDTVIDASGLADRIIEVQAGASVTVSGLTMTQGRAAAGAPGQPAGAPWGFAPGHPGASGGAILNAGSLTVTDAAITNSAAGQGGAGGAGGAGGGIFNTGNLTLTRVTIANNRAGAGGTGEPGEQGVPNGGDGGVGGAAGAGGGVANQGGDVTIADSTIRGNNAGAGGAGGTGGSYLNSEPSVGGAGGAGAVGADGGGVWTQGGQLTVTNSTFVSDTTGSGGDGGAGGLGGGLGGNGGDGGRGAAIGVAGKPAVRLVNLTVVGNGAGTGGAAGVGAAGASPPAGVAGDSGGGGLATSGAEVPIENSLLALNPAGNCAPGSVLDGGHNLAFGDSTCPSTFASGDPKLGPLEDNGGPTQTIGIGPGSAAVDQIPSGSDCPAADQRGVPRPSGVGCDIGAYELAPPVVGAGAEAAAARASGRHAATIVAVITPNAGQARVWIEYGRTQRYGQRSAVHTVGGVTPANVSIRLPGLSLEAAYHYRIVVSTIDGVSQTGDRLLALPILGALVVAPDPVRAAGSPGSGTTVSYTDPRRALTTFAVQRLRHGKWVTLGEFRHRDRAGRNRVDWSGRLSGRPVGPGAYRLLATPRADGATGPASTVRFKIVA
jgi:hypothetical protein